MNLLYIHLGFMIVFFVISLVAGLIAKFLRKKSWWLKIHKLLNQIKTILAIFGFIIAILMVNNFQMNHFSSIHGIIGLFVFLLILLQSIAGFIITNKYLVNLKSLQKANILRYLRIIHKKSGLIIIILILFNIFIGLSRLF